MSIKDIKDSTVIYEATEAFLSLKYGNNYRTSIHSKELQEVLSTSIDCPEKPEGFNFKVLPGKYHHDLVDTICLTSGGADSTIAYYLANKPTAIYIDIGQSYSYKEKEVLHNLGIKFIDVDLTYLRTRDGTEKDWKHIIPGRNFLFLTVAAEYLKDKGELFFAVTDGEGWHSGKGDKSEKFVSQWVKWYEAVTGKYIDIYTAVSNTKAGWLKEFDKDGHDINIIRYKTVTCFSKSFGQCGTCQACLRKYLSFLSAFGLDTSADYKVHPMFGCEQYIKKYLLNLANALTLKDFSHYSEKRCNEDLNAIKIAYELSYDILGKQ